MTSSRMLPPSLALSSSRDAASSFPSKLMGEITGAYSQSLAFSKQMEAESESNEETEDIRAKGLLRLVF